MRVGVQALLLPHDDGVVERARVGDDARDPGADVAEVGDECARAAAVVEVVRDAAEWLARLGA